MTEYIKKEDARRAIEHYDPAFCFCIEYIPAADVVEVDWKPVVGYEGLYEVSPLGQVRNKKGVLLRQGLKKGSATYYKVVSLRKDGEAKTKYVHRLVLEAFVDNPDNLPFVNHIDEDGTNNVVTNLEWCTREYNVNYGTAKERRAIKIRGIAHAEEHNRKISNSMKDYYKKHKSSAKGRRDENGKKVVLMDDCGHEMIFATIRDAALYTDGYVQNIAACCNGKRKTTAGFKWKWFDADGERRSE